MQRQLYDVAPSALGGTATSDAAMVDVVGRRIPRATAARARRITDLDVRIEAMRDR